MTESPITWDKYALQVNGKREFFMSGEFHYWRVPDRARWAEILKVYKIAGLNAVRIYFHWGYHSVTEGVYRFDGNRDVDYLLRLCEELGLRVFVAPGPYICAETQAGGYPLWLVGKPEVRIKHLKRTAMSKYDPQYMYYCRQWWESFIPQITSHQLTQNPAGCVIAFQVENEYRQQVAILKGLRRYMVELQQCARELGVTVPTFHDDDNVFGSWNGLVDLYAFNRYPVFAPKFPKHLPIPAWDVGKFCKATAGIEMKVRSFGPPASDTPIIVPELQGGWYNHWTISYGYDDLYDFYGSAYQKMVAETFAAEGVTMMSFYMFYGGTNYGAIGNPEVYTSYDYAACVREFGYQSDRFRLLRLFNLFVQSFGEDFASTDNVPAPARGSGEVPPLTCSEARILNRHRRSAVDGTDFFFLRNFTKNGTHLFHMTLPGRIRVPQQGDQELPPRESFVAVGNCPLGDFTTKFCSMPILVKGPYAGGMLLVLQHNGGELLLEGVDFTMSGDAHLNVEQNFTRIFFPAPGFAIIQSPSEKFLYLICLSRVDAFTLNADFSQAEVRVAWGAYSLFFAPGGSLEVETVGPQLVVLAAARTTTDALAPVESLVLPGVQKGLIGVTIFPPVIEIQPWARYATDPASDAEIWTEIDFTRGRNPITHSFFGGHVLYKCEFTALGGPKLQLTLNVRHKAGVWLNGQCLGGHSTYSVAILKHLRLQAGGMNGPDPKGKGVTYDLAPTVKWGERNVLFVIVETLGQCKQYLVLNDARNPRGILRAIFSSAVGDVKWFIAGIDVSTLEDPYNTAGIPGEKQGLHLGFGEYWTTSKKVLHVSPSDQIIWLKTQFTWHLEETVRMPLRAHIDGRFNASIFLNGQCIGRYWGAAGPQHDFYLMDGFVQDGTNSLVLACWTTEEADVMISVRPYLIIPASGNIDDAAGTLFASSKTIISL